MACSTHVKRTFADIATAIAHQSGRPISFLLAAFIIIVWAITGPIFHYSDTWQLIINTGTTIITFLMVFIIQNTQNRDSAAVQAKLDELIRVSAAHNTLIGIEHLTQDEISDISEKCLARAKKQEMGCKGKRTRKQKQLSARQCRTVWTCRACGAADSSGVCNSPKSLAKARAKVRNDHTN